MDWQMFMFETVDPNQYPFNFINVDQSTGFEMNTLK